MLILPTAEQPIAPTYREAYPAMTMTGMRNAWVDGTRERQWHNQLGELVARLEVLDWADTYAEVWCEWIENGQRLSQRDVLAVHHRPTLTGRKQAVASCARCHSATTTLFLVAGRWRCAECHELVPLVSLLDKAEKLLEKSRRLHGEVFGRDPPTRGFQTWDRKRLQFEMMKRDPLWSSIADFRPHLRARVGGEWVSENQADDPEELMPIGYRTPLAPTPVPGVMPWFG